MFTFFDQPISKRGLKAVVNFMQINGLEQDFHTQRCKTKRRENFELKLLRKTLIEKFWMHISSKLTVRLGDGKCPYKVMFSSWTVSDNTSDA